MISAALSKNSIRLPFIPAARGKQRFGNDYTKDSTLKTLEPVLNDLQAVLPDDKKSSIYKIREVITQAVTGWESLLYSKDKELKYLKKASITDVLTGLPNRQFFQHQLDNAFVKSNRDQHPLSLVLIDMDKLKSVNDQFGHEGGDVMLKLLANLCATNSRRNETPNRIGGEEFAMVLENTTAEETGRIARRLNKRVGECYVTGDWKQALKGESPENLKLAETILQQHGLSFSAGVVTYNPGKSAHTITDPKELLSIADVGLYLCKGTPIANKWLDSNFWRNVKGSRNRIYEMQLDSKGKVTPHLQYVGKSALERGVKSSG